MNTDSIPDVLRRRHRSFVGDGYSLDHLLVLKRAADSLDEMDLARSINEQRGKALALIRDIARGSTTANSLPNIAKIAEEALITTLESAP